jgi:hypothetical protein
LFAFVLLSVLRNAVKRNKKKQNEITSHFSCLEAKS